MKSKNEYIKKIGRTKYVISVNIPYELFRKASEQRLNISEILEDALIEVLKNE